MLFRSWTVIPIILSQTVYQLSGIVDVTLFNVVMGGKNFADKTVSSLLGIYSTNYRVLVSVPIAVSTAIASSMIPGLAFSVAEGDMPSVRHKVSIAVKFNMIIAFPSAVGLAVLAQPIIRLLFPSSDYIVGGTMLMLGELGEIVAVDDSTMNVLFAIAKGGEELLLPAHEEFITKLDKKKRLLTVEVDRKSTRLNSSHSRKSRMPSSA